MLIKDSRGADWHDAELGPRLLVLLEFSSSSKQPIAAVHPRLKAVD